MGKPTDPPRGNTLMPSLNHVAISVPDCEAATQWYAKLFSMRPTRPVVHTIRSKEPDAAVFKIYNDPSLLEVKIGWLIGPGLAGLELCEFIKPAFEPSEGGFQYQKAGYFHMAMTVEDVDEHARKVVDAGGKMVGGGVVTIFRGKKVSYVQDPWGNVIELMSDHFERMHGFDVEYEVKKVYNKTTRTKAASLRSSFCGLFMVFKRKRSG